MSQSSSAGRSSFRAVTTFQAEGFSASRTAPRSFSHWGAGSGLRQSAFRRYHPPRCKVPARAPSVGLQTAAGVERVSSGKPHRGCHTASTPSFGHSTTLSTSPTQWYPIAVRHQFFQSETQRTAPAKAPLLGDMHHPTARCWTNPPEVGDRPTGSVW